jgi:DNA mismatch endonuclease (patch repair protein)
LPGKPDLVFAPRRKVIFVHGCFWHQHSGCREGKLPSSNQDYWKPKLARNVNRDVEHVTSLQANGWDTLVIWECETKDEVALSRRLNRFLRGR